MRENENKSIKMNSDVSEQRKKNGSEWFESGWVLIALENTEKCCQNVSTHPKQLTGYAHTVSAMFKQTHGNVLIEIFMHEITVTF